MLKIVSGKERLDAIAHSASDHRSLQLLDKQVLLLA
jgi:hypothetical protein